MLEDCASNTFVGAGCADRCRVALGRIVLGFEGRVDPLAGGNYFGGVRHGTDSMMTGA